MAIFHCDWGTHRYPGAQQTIYPAVVNGTESFRTKLRLCPTHFAQLAAKLETNTRSAQASYDEPDLVHCLHCHRDASNSRWQFFATAYAKGSERMDYWSVVCDDCAVAVCEQWHIPTDMP